MLVNGDVIFVNYNDTENLKAISKVSQGYKEQLFNHVGMFKDGFIIDATPSGVKKKSLESFLDNADSKVLIAKHNLQEEASNKIINFIGCEYNNSYVESTTKFYCSELIHHVFELANGSKLFKKHKLSFKDEHNEVSDYWKKYYKELGIAVPINSMGSNPQNLSNSNVFQYKIIISKGEIINEKQ